MDIKFNTTLRDNYVLGSVYSLIINYIFLIITSYIRLLALSVLSLHVKFHFRQASNKLDLILIYCNMRRFWLFLNRGFSRGVFFRGMRDGGSEACFFFKLLCEFDNWYSCGVGGITCYIVEIALYWTFSFVDQLNNDINLTTSTNNEKTTLRYLNSWRLCQPPPH